MKDIILAMFGAFLSGCVCGCMLMTNIWMRKIRNWEKEGKLKWMIENDLDQR